MNLGASLPYKYVTGQDKLPIAPFNSETLGITVSAISTAANALLMCHV